MKEQTAMKELGELRTKRKEIYSLHKKVQDAEGKGDTETADGLRNQMATEAKKLFSQVTKFADTYAPEDSTDTEFLKIVKNEVTTTFDLLAATSKLEEVEEIKGEFNKIREEVTKKLGVHAKENELKEEVEEARSFEVPPSERREDSDEEYDTDHEEELGEVVEEEPDEVVEKKPREATEEEKAVKDGITAIRTTMKLTDDLIQQLEDSLRHGARKEANADEKNAEKAEELANKIEQKVEVLSNLHAELLTNLQKLNESPDPDDEKELEKLNELKEAAHKIAASKVNYVRKLNDYAPNVFEAINELKKRENSGEKPSKAVEEEPDEAVEEEPDEAVEEEPDEAVEEEPDEPDEAEINEAEEARKKTERKTSKAEKKASDKAHEEVLAQQQGDIQAAYAQQAAREAAQAARTARPEMSLTAAAGVGLTAEVAKELKSGVTTVDDKANTKIHRVLNSDGSLSLSVETDKDGNISAKAEAEFLRQAKRAIDGGANSFDFSGGSPELQQRMQTELNSYAAAKGVNIEVSGEHLQQPFSAPSPFQMSAKPQPSAAKWASDEMQQGVAQVENAATADIPYAHPADDIPYAYPAEDIPYAHPAEDIPYAHPAEDIPYAHPAEDIPYAHPPEDIPRAYLADSGPGNVGMEEGIEMENLGGTQLTGVPSANLLTFDASSNDGAKPPSLSTESRAVTPETRHDSRGVAAQIEEAISSFTKGIADAGKAIEKAMETELDESTAAAPGPGSTPGPVAH